jgi:hypothetical protein
MCSTELAAYRRLVEMSADEHRRIAPPLTDWRGLSPLLRQEGLITTPLERAHARLVRMRVVRFVSGTAAAVTLVAGGAFYGRLSAGLPVRDALALTDTRFTGEAANDVSVTREEFANTAAALEVLQVAQQEYERAAFYLATHDTSTSEAASDVLRSRLAALGEVAEASLRVLEDAPADPIMNQVLLTALGARELTLTRLGTALPVGTRLTRW